MHDHDDLSAKMAAAGIPLLPAKSLGFRGTPHDHSHCCGHHHHDHGHEHAHAPHAEHAAALPEAVAGMTRRQKTWLATGIGATVLAAYFINSYGKTPAAQDKLGQQGTERNR